VERASVVSAGSPIKGRVAVLVVEGAFAGVTEDLVGLAEFLELLLGGFVTGILIRMVLQRELAVGLFDFFLLRASLDAEDFVTIAFSNGSGGHLLGYDDAGRA
jgi:hypothetical protein